MDIINLTQYADALRSTGYKNIESAVAEIIDNSIEAGSKDILILLKESLDKKTGRKRITDVAFLDNGCGMDRNTLQNSIRIGCGTRTERKGIGRFGVGLPQASMHVAPRLEVYSWQNYEKPNKVYLDVDEMRAGTQDRVFEPTEEDILDEFNFLEYENRKKSFKESGTMVVWKNCDNISPSKIITLTNRLSFELGKRFRYFISNEEVEIKIIDITNSANPTIIEPNDPLFLMENNSKLGNPENQKIVKKDDFLAETIFEPFTGNDNEYPNGIVEIPIKYMDRKTRETLESKVEVKLSIVREKYYSVDNVPNTPGDTVIGKEVKKLEGISIVRAKREIDFGKFEFYSSVNTPVHRWWGCEITFGTELDEIFGVSNNKQHVEIINVLEETADYSEEEIPVIWEQLKIVKELIQKMKKRNEDLRKGSRKNGKKITQTESIINGIEINKGSGVIEKPKLDSEPSITIELVKEDERRAGILENGFGIIEVDEEESGKFFEIECSNEACIGKINTESSFGKNFFGKIKQDESMRVCFEFLLGAMAKAKEEFEDEEERNTIDDFIETWNEKVEKYITKYLGK